jgi:hypothetical protein
MLGQQPPCGTGDSRILIDEEHMNELLKDFVDKKIELIDIKEDDEDDDDDIGGCDDNDLQVKFDLTKNNSRCYKLPEQKVKFV